jgi:alkanesulfonate monooxygenase SsuD/methylene tetrahydromethanopterin reductase-like flavin-dependent oxidoreductase (luciferase family)
VAIVTEPFEETVRAVAEANGLPGYPFVLVPHPIASDGDDELRRKAELAALKLVPLLTERRGA